jgi:Glycosyl hydrolases family 18
MQRRNWLLLLSLLTSLALTSCLMVMTPTQQHASAAEIHSAASSGPHRVIYYYQTLTDLSPIINNLNPATKKPYTTDINLASFHLGKQSDGTLIHLNDFPPDNPVFNTPWQQLAQLQSMGVKLHMMLGGAAAGSYQSLFSDWNTFYPVLKQTLQNHHFSGIDLDIEESVALSDVERLINQLSSDFGSSFQITLAPVASDLTGGGGLSGFNYKDLYQAQGAKIAWFNTQFYSGFGSLASVTDYENAINNGFPPDKVVAGMLGNPNDGGGYVDVKQVAATVKQLSHKYSNFGGVFSWEYFDSLPGGTAHPDQWSKLMAQAMK